MFGQQTIADVIRTCLGPRAMMKMLLDPMGGIVMTNDGNAILREIQVQHPAANVPVDLSDRSVMLNIINSAINTKALSRWADMACNIALDAVRMVEMEENGRKEIDIKKYAKVEKVPGGFIEESCVLRGVMVNKDVTHPRMKRLIKEPRIILLDCSLEYKKGESQTDIEISRDEDFVRILQMEEEYIQQICGDIIRLKPDLVFTEKGISDLAQHYLVKANITAIRRVRKTDNNRIARACGARIASRTDELREEDVGREPVSLRRSVTSISPSSRNVKTPKACTILLRGASKEILAEVERNLQDAMQVCRNVLLDPSLLPGGGAVEMAVSKRLTERSRALTGVEQWPYRAVAQALEVLPRTLIQNCGASTIRVLTSLRAKHTEDNSVSWGVNGETGTLADMSTLGIVEPLAVKAQTYKTAVEGMRRSTDELREEDVGTGAGLFEVKKIGDEYFTFVTECKDPKACTILLRGASKEILAEVERNLQDAMQVCRNVLLDPSLLPGGGAVEMAVSKRLTERSRALTGVEQWPYRAVAQALEVLPRTLIQNCGASTIRVLTSLR
ncbi:LOW QUALITY PROTEIN: hypothetical protein CRUP_032961, partial [Coryphaenoides rupestris]